MRVNHMTFGPPMPIISVKDFSRLCLTSEQWAEVWSIIGPSVERNMTRYVGLQLWRVIAAAYLEGLHHGSQSAIEIEPP